MLSFSETYKNITVRQDTLALFWLGQAGFLIKTSAGKLICIDPYLSDSCHRLLGDYGYGFKRMMPVPIAADDLVLDVLLISHDHPDHLDADSIRALCMHDKTRVLASHVSSDRLAAEFSIAPDKLTRLSPGDSVLLQSLTVQATRADHGALCPDALGFVLDFGFARIYYAGDTAYNRSLQQEIQRISPDVALLPINGAYGNMDAAEAALFAVQIGARIAIPYHFWMFPNHGGAPESFEPFLAKLSSACKPILLRQGEHIIVTAQNN